MSSATRRRSRQARGCCRMKPQAFSYHCFHYWCFCPCQKPRAVAVEIKLFKLIANALLPLWMLGEFPEEVSQRGAGSVYGALARSRSCGSTVPTCPCEDQVPNLDVSLTVCQCPFREYLVEQVFTPGISTFFVVRISLIPS